MSINEPTSTRVPMLPNKRPGTQRAGNTTNRDSSTLRASVFDVFLELGALEHDSRLAEWILNDPPLDENPTGIDTATPRFRTDHGSRFREALNNDSDDEETKPQISYSLPPKKPGFFAAVRSKSRARKSPDKTKRLRDPPPASDYLSRKKTSFFRRPISPDTSVTVSSRPVISLRSPSSPAGQVTRDLTSSFAGSTPQSTPSTPDPEFPFTPTSEAESSHLDSTTHSRTETFASEDWTHLSVDISPSELKSLTFAPHRNPFLHGNGSSETIKEQVPFPASANGGLLRQFSFARIVRASTIKRPKDLRRTQSRPEAPSKPFFSRISLLRDRSSSGLKTTLSHD